MEKIKKIINKYDVLFIIIIMVIFNIIWLRTDVLEAMDEIWIFQYINQIIYMKKI